MEPILQLNEFFVEGNNPELSHVLLHITEPSTPEEKKKGYFFAVCEINGAEKRQILRLQSLIDELENGYYETPDSERKTSLEMVLEKINEESFPLLKNGCTLNCVVGVLRPPEIFFSYCGRPQIYIFYKNREGAYQKMDLVEGEEAAEGEAKTPLFVQIIQGKISPQDYFFAGSPHLIDYFNSDRLQKIITTRPPRQSSEHLERILSELQNGASFGGLVIHLSQTDTPALKKIKTRVQNGSAKSLRSLFNTEQNTAQTLSPSLLRRFSDRIGSAWEERKSKKPTVILPEKQVFPETEIESAHMHQHQMHRPIKSEPRANLINYLRYAWKALTLIGQGLLWLVLALWTLLKSLLRGLGMSFLVITNYQNRRQNVLDDWSRAIYSHRQNFKQLSGPAKILLVASIVLAAAFVVSLLYLRWHQRAQAETQAFQDSLQLIRTKKDAAESALIYNNETTALSEAQSALALLRGLPDCAAKKPAPVCTELQGQLESTLTKVRKLTTVEPELLIDWGENARSLKKIVKIDDKIFAFSPSTSTLFVYDLLTKNNYTVPADRAIIGFKAAAVPKENDYLLFLYNDHELLKYDPKTNAFQKADVSYPGQNTVLQGLLIYNRRLYSLDAASNQILKHDSIKTGFGLGKEWVRDNTDLKDASDLTIDGDIFVLKANGQIYKFTNGLKQSFDIIGLDPALTGGDKIWTYTDLQNIYVLESANKRLVILNKEGKLLNQITALKFSSPTGLAVEETKHQAYILDQGKLYRITLP